MSFHEVDEPLEEAHDLPADDPAQAVPTGANFRSRKQLRYLGLLAAGVLVMILVSVLMKKPTNFEEYVTTSGYAGVFLMGVIGSAAPIWPLPGSWAAFIAGGLGLNPWLLGLAAGLGEPIGELAGYTAGYGSQVVINKWRRYSQIVEWMKRHGGPTIFVVSAIPNFFIKLATAAAGALRYPLWRFFIFCWAGKTVKSIAFAFAGAGLFDGIKALIDRIF